MCTACVDAIFGGVDAERGVVLVVVRFSSALPSIVVSPPGVGMSAARAAALAAAAPLILGGVILCGRELLVTGVGGNCADGDGLANGGDCCLRELGELVVPALPPGLVVPAS